MGFVYEILVDLHSSVPPPMGLLDARLVRRWCGFAAVLCLCASSSCDPGTPQSQNQRGRHSSESASTYTHVDVSPIEPLPLPDEPGARSLQCFDDGQVYGCCEDAYRLDPSGIIGVPVGAVDYYCGGACVVETEDLLSCVASALDGFKFHNGASVEDVRYALRRGCSHTVKRGDFNDLEPQVGDYPDIYGDYGSNGHRAAAASLELLGLFVGAAWLLVMPIC